MGLLILEWSPRFAWHIAAALEVYRRQLRSDGLPAAKEVAEFGAAMAGLAARDCPDLPDPREIADLLQDRPMPPLLLSVAQAAKVLGLSERQVARMVRSGELASVKVGSRVLLRRADLEAYAAGLPSRRWSERLEVKAGDAVSGAPLAERRRAAG